MTGDVGPFVVTLVHGTFARGAAWANDADALIRRRLHAAFGDAVRVRAFNWSGGNSHPHRWRAAEELRADQAALALSEPGLPRFVVAHSHGGNVALYALGDAAPPVCGAPFGSCTQLGGSACDEYSGDIPADMARTQCEQAGNTYASTPCNTTGAVGGCRFDLPDGVDGMGRWCTTTWMFPPATTDNVMQLCVTPGVYVPPP